MATNRPRKNVYLDDGVEDKLKDFSHSRRISESETCRRALNLYLELANTPEFDAAQALADAKSVFVDVVLVQALRRQVPPMYFKR